MNNTHWAAISLINMDEHRKIEIRLIIKLLKNEIRRWHKLLSTVPSWNLLFFYLKKGYLKKKISGRNLYNISD